MKTRASALLARYNAKIDPVLDKLISFVESNITFTESQTAKAQSILDKIADEFQHQEDLGLALHKLYLAQSAIYVLGNQKAKAQEFLNESKRYSVNADTKVIESALAATHPELGKTPTNTFNSDISTILLQVKHDGVKDIWIGLLLIAISLAITIVSYNMADSGGSFSIFWGLAIWGLVLLMRGIYRYVNPVSGLEPSVKSANRQLPSRRFGAWVSVVAGVFLVVIVSFSLIGMFSPDLASQIENGDGTTPESYIANFTDACVDEGVSRSRCTCVAKYLTDHNSMQRLIEIENEVDGSTTPPELTEAVNNCN